MSKEEDIKKEQAELDKEQLEAAKKKKEEETKEEIETETVDQIDKANEAAERQERANKKHEELVVRQERLAVNNALGGESEVTPKQSKEEKDTEEAQKLVPKEMLDLSKKEN